MISGFKNVIACEPFAVRQISTTQVGVGQRKFNAINSKTLLTPLKVVFGLESEDIQPGDEIYLLHDVFASPWSKEMEIEGIDKKVVLVTLDQVKLVKRVR